MSRETTERRLSADSLARLEADEVIVAWCRVWVSWARHFQKIAPRWRDVVVVTDRRVMIFTVGHFTRRPRHRFLADRLDELTVTDVGTHPGRGLRLTREGRGPILVELGSDAWSRKVALELQTRACGDATTTPDPASPPVERATSERTAS